MALVEDTAVRAKAKGGRAPGPQGLEKSEGERGLAPGPRGLDYRLRSLSWAGCQSPLAVTLGVASKITVAKVIWAGNQSPFWP
jgi:hypothetical protein